ncbi:MAG: sigma 54-interacting transcriptional regulator [Planctomycetota bacterium]
MNESGDLLTEFAQALEIFRNRGRSADVMRPLLDWLIRTIGAERAFLFAVRDDGSYHVRGARNADGEVITDAERWISLYVVRRALDSKAASFFPDARSDRRLRTEGEREHGVRARSILALPLATPTAQSILYLDSRFRPIEWRDPPTPALQLVLDLLLFLGELDAAEHELRMLRRRLSRETALASATAASAVTANARVVPAPADFTVATRELDFHGFLTRSPALIAALDEMRRLAPSNLAILIEGESGTGKEVLARAIHAESGRKGPFVTLSSGVMPDTLVEIQLFGHDKGAFTGAEHARAGIIEQARGGTLFIDDIGEMSDELQAALLRVLETGRYRRVSGETDQDADIRVLSALQLSVQRERSIGALRSDLYFRLAGSAIRIPPLRDRSEDIVLLERMLRARLLGVNEVPRLKPEVELAIVTYHWPGNVRELLNLIRRVLALGEVELTLERFQQITGFQNVEATVKTGSDVRSVIDRTEREVILRALSEQQGNKSLAARALGLSRKTLYRRMEKHGIPL